MASKNEKLNRSSKKAAKNLQVGDLVGPIDLSLINGRVRAIDRTEEGLAITIHDFELKSRCKSSSESNKSGFAFESVAIGGNDVESLELIISVSPTQRIASVGLTDSDVKKITAAPNEQVVNAITQKDDESRREVIETLLSTLSSKDKELFFSNLNKKGDSFE